MRSELNAASVCSVKELCASPPEICGRGCFKRRFLDSNILLCSSHLVSTVHVFQMWTTDVLNSVCSRIALYVGHLQFNGLDSRKQTLSIQEIMQDKLIFFSLVKY